MFSSSWEQRKKSYDVVVVGSGYGGAISAARIATANLSKKPSVCVLERGKECQEAIGSGPTKHSFLH